MKNRKLLLMSAVALAPLAWGCSSSDDTAGTGGSAGTAGSSGGNGGANSAGSGGVSDAATPDVSTDGAAPLDGSRDAAEGGDGGTVTFVRIAHLSPGAPAIDVCLRLRAVADGGTDAGDAATDTGAQDSGDAEASVTDAGADADAAAAPFSIGPVFKSLGVTAGLAYSQVSEYLKLAPGAYDVRIVAPNSVDCSTALAGLPDTITLPIFVAGGYATVGAIGLITSDTGPNFELRAYTDEHTVTAGQAKLRFVHASPTTPNVDVGLGTAESFVPIFANVPYGGVGVGLGVDVSGYFEQPPVSSQTLVTRAHGVPTDVLVVPGFSLAAGQIASTFAVGIIGSATTPARTLICFDLDATKAPLSNCSLQPVP